MGIRLAIRTKWREFSLKRERQAVISSIYAPNTPEEDTVNQINSLSLEQRTLLCINTISSKEVSPFKSFYIGGHTALTLALHKGQYKIAEALLEGIDAEERIKIFNSLQEFDVKRSKQTFKKVAFETWTIVKTLPLIIMFLPAIIMLRRRQVRASISAIYNNLYKAGEIVNHSPFTLLLIHNQITTAKKYLASMSEAQINSLFNTPDKELNIALLALNNCFAEEPLKKYAQNNNLNLAQICLDIFDSKHTIFKTALQIESSAQLFTYAQRKAFLLQAQNKPLVRELMNAPNTVLYLDNWLREFTAAEKIAALTPPEHAEGADNPLIVRAFESGNIHLTQWLVNQGIELPERFRQRANAGGIQYGQSIHNPAVHHTVGESLIELKKAHPLQEAELITAIAGLIAHANQLPESSDNTNIKAVSRRAILRITTAAFLAHSERISGVSVRENLAYFFIKVNSIADKDDRAAAWDVFYNQLFTIQRDYNPDASGADGTICVGGTHNQLTIGLQAVYPELVWVKFVTDQTNAIDGLMSLSVLIQRAFEHSENKGNFAKLCAEKPVGLFIPNALWPLIEADLRHAMKETLINRQIQPRQRRVLPTEAEVDAIVAHALQIIKGGPRHPRYVSDMTRAANVLQTTLKNIVDINENANAAKINRVLAEPRSSDRTLEVSNNLGLQQSQRSYDEQQKNVHASTRVGVQELYLNSYNSTLSGYSLEYDHQLLKQCKPFAAKTCPAEKLPESFEKMACDRGLLNQLIGVVQNSRRRQAVHTDIYLLDTFNESGAAPAWLNNRADFDQTMRILNIEPFDKNENEKDYQMNLDKYLFKNSTRIYETLFALAPVMIKKELKNEAAQTLKSVRPH